MGLCIHFADDKPEERTVSWSYSGFGSWRERIAAAFGMDLHSMHGFGGESMWPGPALCPLQPLLYHSDCDGEISPADCEVVAPTLAAIAMSGKLDATDSYNAALLAGMMIEAKATNRKLEFH